MGNIRSQLFKVVQPPAPSTNLGDSLRRSNDGADEHDCIGLSTEKSHDSDSVNNFCDDNEFVMVTDVGLSDYIFIESFEFVPNPSFESKTLL